VIVLGVQLRHGELGILWTATTTKVMFAVAAGRSRNCEALGDTDLCGEAKITLAKGCSRLLF